MARGFGVRRETLGESGRNLSNKRGLEPPGSHNVRLSKRQLAPRHAASTDETRYNLNGVHIKPDGSTEATDGHMLIQVSRYVEDDGEETRSIERGVALGSELSKDTIVTLDGVDSIRRAMPKRKDSDRSVMVDVKESNLNGSVRVVWPDGECRSEKVVGEYPNTGQVIPEISDGDIQFCVNFQLLERLAKAVKEFKSEDRGKSLAVKVTIRPTSGEDGCGLVLTPIRFDATNDAGEELLGVIMPMRL